MPKTLADLPLAEEAPGGFFPNLAQQTRRALAHGPIYRRHVNMLRGPQTLVIGEWLGQNGPSAGELWLRVTPRAQSGRVAQ